MLIKYKNMINNNSNMTETDRDNFEIFINDYINNNNYNQYYHQINNIRNKNQNINTNLSIIISKINEQYIIEDNNNNYRNQYNPHLFLYNNYVTFELFVQ